VIFQEQEPSQKAVFNRDDPWQRAFPSETRARSFFYSADALPPRVLGAWHEGPRGLARIEPGGKEEEVLGDAILRGSHNRMNLLCAGLMLRLYGIPSETVRAGLAAFPGVEHRMEAFHEWNGVRFVNDSAATIPHATVAALRALEGPVVLITGGTDKNLDFSPLREVLGVPRATVLLAGTGTDKIRPLLEEQGASYDGPYDSLAPAVQKAISRAREAAGEQGAWVLFSPGCTSFGMFLNEFDRGRKFKATVNELTGREDPTG